MRDALPPPSTHDRHSRAPLTTDSRDRREGGRWSLGQRAKNDVLWWLASSALAVTGGLRGSTLRRLGVALGRAAYVLVPSARRIAEANVSWAFPELGVDAQRALVRRTYDALGVHLGDVVAMLDSSRPIEPLPFTPGARACLRGAMDEGHGVLFASAHLGPWERVAATLVADGVPLTVIAREAYDPRLTSIYDRLRGGRGVHTIYRGAPGAAAGLLRTLRRGNVLGIPMDLASRVPSIDVPFLGRDAPTPVGPARIALRTRAAVVVGTAAPLDDDVDDGVGVEVTRIRTDDLEASAEGERELTIRINDELGARIRALPEGWVWMHPRWRQPDGPRHRTGQDVERARLPAETASNTQAPTL